MLSNGIDRIPVFERCGGFVQGGGALICRSRVRPRGARGEGRLVVTSLDFDSRLPGPEIQHFHTGEVPLCW